MAPWNPFDLLELWWPKKVTVLPTQNQEIEMSNLSEFEIPSAILTASLVAKSTLSGAELEEYAVNTQRKLINQMIAFRQYMESKASKT